MVQSRLLHTVRPGPLFDTVWAGADVGRVLNYECCLSDVDYHGGFRGSKWEMVFTRLSGLPSVIALLYMAAAGEIHVSSLDTAV